MQAPWRAVRAMSILLASCLALACNNDFAIFRTIQGEKKQVGTQVFDETSVSNVFGLLGNYYAATGTLNGSPVGQDSWSTVAIGSPPSTNYALRSAVLAGNQASGTVYALIEIGVEPNMTIKVYSTVDGVNWINVPIPAQTVTGANAFTFDALYGTSTNGLVFAEGHAYNTNTSDPTNPGPSTYTLWYSQGGAAFQQVTHFAPGIDRPIRGVVCDNSGNYYFASEDLLQMSPTCSDGGSDFSSIAAPGTFPNQGTTSTTIWDISFTGSALYVSRQDGVLFQYSFPSGPVQSVSLGSLPLTQVIQVPSAITGTTLLVGSDAIGAGSAAVGYYEGTWGNIQIGSNNSEVASNSSVFATTVAQFPVHAFYWDQVNGNLFVAVSPGFSSTSYYGLYKSAWTGTWAGWSAQ